MLRVWMLLLIMALGTIGGTVVTISEAEADSKSDSVFVDEGDGDFDTLPSVPPQAAAQNAPDKKLSHKETKKTVRAPASAAASGGTYMTTKMVCPILRAPASESEPMSAVKVPRKIWVEKVDDQWVRAYTKSGEPGYVSTSCLE